MSTFPYVDISHKKIWRPLSTGRYVDPTVFALFIYFGAGSLPSRPDRGALCKRGRSRGDSGGDVARSRRVGAAGGLRAALPALPRSPLFSPRLVTIRRNVVAGSMTPWVEAAAPLSSLLVAAGSGRAARAGGHPSYLPRAGPERGAVPTPRSGAGPPARGGGLRGRPRGPRPGCPPQAGPRPPAASASPSPRSSRNGSWRSASAPRERFILVGVAASLWLPRDWVAKPWQTCPCPRPLCRRLRRGRWAESWGPGGHHGMVPLASQLCSAWRQRVAC